uniref:Uncharacterized protein n=1 Tax=Dulem virus 66 TaxID=3145777 RepID=A0AAU8AVI6_9VIRU
MTEAMTTAMNTAFTNVKADVMDVMSKALPAGLAIMGVVLAVTIGVRFFKKVAN